MRLNKSKYYYNSKSDQPFKISRSKIDLFLECPRCFYLDRNLGIARPSMPGFSLNSAVDTLLKKEFDLLREKRQPHSLMKKYNIDAIPFKHPDLDKWRENFVGIQYHHEITNLVITGAIDDIWEDRKGQLMIVDYKSTSTEKEISLDDYYKRGFKRQMEVYQWIFRKKGFPVSSQGYFVYANAGKNRDSFDGKLEFELTIISYSGNDSWVEPAILEIKKLLDQQNIPSSGKSCEYCLYLSKIADIENQQTLF